MKDIDVTNLRPAMVQYAEIKNKYKDYLVFYRMGDFYELFFEDAITASAALDIALTKRGKTQSQNIPMCGVPFHAYENYLTRLVRQGYKVAICEQMETPEEARKRGRNEVVRRDVVRLVTAGTLTEDDMLDARRNNFLLAVAYSSAQLGFAWVDISTGAFYTEAIPCLEEALKTNLPGFLNRLDASEIIIADSLLQYSNLYDVLRDFRKKLSVLPYARFNATNAQKRIEDFYKVSAIEALGNFTKQEITAAGILLEYIENTQKGKIPFLKRPLKYNNVPYMEIDSAAQRNLELVIGINGDKKACLLGVIDKTITGSGARLLANRVKMPSTDILEINKRLDVVDFFVKIPEIRQELREVLHNVYDLERSVSRLSLNRGGPRDLAAIGATLSYLPRIRNLIRNCKRYTDIFEKIPTPVEEILLKFGEFSNLVSNLSEALADDLPAHARDGGFIKEGYSAALDNLRDSHVSNTGAMEKLAAKYTEMTGVPNIRINHNSIIGYYLEIPQKYAKEILQNPYFIFKQSVLNAARFSTAELNELENGIRATADKALSLELELYAKLVEDVLCVSDELTITAEALAELDFSSALAELAIEGNYCRPVLDDSLDFDIKEGRHPVVEASLTKNQEGQFIGNDCSLNALNNRIWLITGPNMAGKSTFLRQNAIIAIMAQMGSFVPCSSAHIGIIDKVFSRVGASDDLSRGHSTFMVEMVETAAILNQATPKSFVIVDEIGRGTATYDGLSIAWAVVEHLHEINHCRTLFATHYHELTILNKKLEALTLHCMKIKEYKDNVVFLHEVTEGAQDRSYGIHVAKMAGLPNLVIKRAEKILQSLETNPDRQTVTAIEDDLPLFSVFKQQAQKEETLSPLQEALKSLNPDDYSPRDALEKLYELKKLFNENN